ncbi:MAG: ABC transporter permease [Gemmatimonadota bacterium]
MLMDFTRLPFGRAVRSLTRSGTFSVLVIVTLATGIAAWTTMFCITNSLVLRPLPVQDQDRIVLGWRADVKRGATGLPLTEEQLNRFVATSRTFERIGAISASGALMSAQKVDDAVIYAKSLVVGGRFFDVLGTGPILGRTLGPEDDAPGAAPAVVIGYGLWQRQFAGSPDVLRRTIRSNARYHVVVGVMPKGFDLPGGAEMWFPLVDAGPSSAPRPAWPYLAVVGRLAPGASLETARAEFGGFLEREERAAPAELPNAAPDVRRIADYVVGEVRPLALVFTAASALLLVLASVNVANLVLIRGASRNHEVAVQLALGASRSRVAWEMIAEGLLLGVAASALGVGISFAAVHAFLILAPADLPRLGEVAFDSKVIIAASAGALVSVLVFGLGPALALSRSTLLDSLRSGGNRQTDSKRGRAVKRSIVVGQVALAQLILVSAGLLLNSWVRLETVKLGFEPSHLVSARLGVGREFADTAVYRRFLRQAVERIEALPGVESVSLGVMPPIAAAGERNGSYFEVGGQAGPAVAGNSIAVLDQIGPGFFHTLQTPVLRGRELQPADLVSSVPLAVVNEAFARAMWPGENPIAKRVRLIDQGKPGAWRTVVGVVADSRYHNLKAADPTIYVPYTQSEEPPFYLLIRSRSAVTVTPVLAALRELTSEVWIPQLMGLPQRLAAPLARPRLDTAVLTCFAILALIMSAAGIYGLGAAYVRQRARELGIRLALGATPSRLLALVLGEGLVLTAVGAGLGAIAGLAVSRSLSGVLYGIGATDPLTVALVMGAVLAVGGIASYVPARRSTRINPAQVLSAE